MRLWTIKSTTYARRVRSMKMRIKLENFYLIIILWRMCECVICYNISKNGQSRITCRELCSKYSRLLDPIQRNYKFWIYPFNCSEVNFSQTLSTTNRSYASNIDQNPRKLQLCQVKSHSITLYNSKTYQNQDFFRSIRRLVLLSPLTLKFKCV